MSADRITAGILKSADGRFELNLNNGTISIGEGFIVDDGDTQTITTKIGYTFGDTGLIIDRPNSPTKTVVDETGMTVKDKSGSVETELFYAGVDEGEAVVRTQFIEVLNYIRIGNNSRIQDYGADRTGIFFVGGD